MSYSSIHGLSNKERSILRQKYLVVDDEIVKNETDKEDLILNIGVSQDLALFASNYEEALKIINLHSDIAICFIDSKIPRNNRDLYNFEQNASSNGEWGISLIPEINKAHKNTDIVVYSAYVTKTYLKSKIGQFNNIKGFFGKPEGIRHLKKLYLEAILKEDARPESKAQAATSSSGHVSSSASAERKNNLAEPTKDEFDYSVLDRELSVYLHEQVAEIKRLVRRSAQDLVDIGQSLIDVKQKLEYGQFLNWLKSEFSWSSRTANRFMRVAQIFGSDNLSDLNILPSALYELSAPSIPATAAREALLRAEQGEIINVDKARKIKTKHLTVASSTATTEDRVQPNLLPNNDNLTTDSTSTTNDATVSPEQNKPQIVKVIRQQKFWQLGEHLLFYGEPNSAEFARHLPSSIALNLAFPNQKDWFLTGSQANSNLSFQSSYGEDLDIQLLLEAVERLIRITTSEGDNIVICFIPHPAILTLAHQLGCRCFLGEPDLSKCKAVRNAWENLSD